MRKLLPDNKPVKYAKSDSLSVWVMSAPGAGKTTFASTWPKPFFINTDGNYKQFNVPTMFVEDVMKIDGVTTYGFIVVEQLVDEFIKQKDSENAYETLVIDLFEDIVKMCDKMIAKQNGKELAMEIPWGRGVKQVNERVKNLLTKLNSINMNVVYLSHMISQQTKDLNGNDITQYVPKELKQEMIATISGRVQLMAALEVHEQKKVNQQTNKIDVNRYRILNWEKSDRLPTVVERFKTLKTYCLADYQHLLDVVKNTEI